MEKTLKVLFNEITAIRVVCKDCGTTIELPLDLAATAPLTCPGCRKQHRRPDIDAAVKKFAEGLWFLQQVSEPEFQIILPIPES